MPKLSIPHGWPWTTPAAEAAAISIIPGTTQKLISMTCCFWAMHQPHGFRVSRNIASTLRASCSYGKPVIDALLHNLTSRVVDVDKGRRIWGGQTPWWFTAPARVTTYSTNLTGFEDRFYKWGFDKIFGSFGEFTRATDRYEFEGIKF